MQKVELELILERCGASEGPRLEASILLIELLLLVDVVFGDAVGVEADEVLEHLPHDHVLGQDPRVLLAEEEVLRPARPATLGC